MYTFVFLYISSVVIFNSQCCHQVVSASLEKKSQSNISVLKLQFVLHLTNVGLNFLTSSSEEKNSNHSDEEEFSHTHHQHYVAQSRTICMNGATKKRITEESWKQKDLK